MATARQKLSPMLLVNVNVGSDIADGSHRVPGTCLLGHPLAQMPCQLVAVPEAGTR